MNEVSRSGYALPKNPGFIGGLGARAKLAGVLAAVVWQWGVTEYLALQFLRADAWPQVPLFSLGRLGIFQPFAWIVWEIQFWRWAAHNTPPFTYGLRTAVCLGIIGGIVVLPLITGIVSQYYARQYSKGIEEIHGSSKWAGRKDLIEAGLLSEETNVNYGGVNLGLWTENGSRHAQYLRDKTDRHVLVCAATGTGKTHGPVIMTALEWAESMFVLDVKGEIYDATAGARQAAGHVVMRLVPMKPDESVHFNPLDFINMGTPEEISDIQKLAEIIGNPGGESPQQTHWNQTSEQLIAGVMLHEIYRCEKEQGRRATMQDLSFGLSPLDKTFNEYLREMVLYEHDPTGMRGWTMPDGTATKTHPFVREIASAALNRPCDEAGSVLSTAKKRFALFGDPLVAAVTANSDFKILELVDGARPVTIYFIVPPSEKERLSLLTRLLVATILSRLTQQPRRHRWELLLLIDEFPTLQYLKPLETALSYCRSYGIRCMLIVQDFGQIFKHYTLWNEIIANCQIQVIFATANMEMAEAVSKTLGSTTVIHGSFSFSGEAKLLPDAKGMSSQIQHAHRNLMEPSEISGLKLPRKNGKKVIAPGEMIVLTFGARPIKGLQGFWFFDQIARRRVAISVKSAAELSVRREVRS